MRPGECFCSRNPSFDSFPWSPDAPYTRTWFQASSHGLPGQKCWWSAQVAYSASVEGVGETKQGRQVQGGHCTYRGVLGCRASPLAFPRKQDGRGSSGCCTCAQRNVTCCERVEPAVYGCCNSLACTYAQFMTDVYLERFAGMKCIRKVQPQASNLDTSLCGGRGTSRHEEQRND